MEVYKNTVVADLCGLCLLEEPAAAQSLTAWISMLLLLPLSKTRHIYPPTMTLSVE